MSHLKKNKIFIQMTDGSSLVLFSYCKKKDIIIESDSRFKYIQVNSMDIMKGITNIKYKRLFIFK
jgi:hypothetical protein